MHSEAVAGRRKREAELIVRTPAARRVHLGKPGTGKTRPIDTPIPEDKILHRAVLMVLDPIYEQDLLFARTDSGRDVVLARRSMRYGAA